MMICLRNLRGYLMGKRLKNRYKNSLTQPKKLSLVALMGNCTILKSRLIKNYWKKESYR